MKLKNVDWSTQITIDCRFVIIIEILIQAIHKYFDFSQIFHFGRKKISFKNFLEFEVGQNPT